MTVLVHNGSSSHGSGEPMIGVEAIAEKLELEFPQGQVRLFGGSRCFILGEGGRHVPGPRAKREQHMTHVPRLVPRTWRELICPSLVGICWCINLKSSKSVIYCFFWSYASNKSLLWGTANSLHAELAGA